MKRDAGTRPLKRHGLGVQKGTLQAMRFKFGVALAIAVLVVAQQRMSGEGGVDADLMRATGRNIHFHQRRERRRKIAPA